ncbi:hypothetical protein [Rhodospirillum rubrum]|uniref:Flagellin n=1 Tax=Rhodospirillum rubrum (strain ATCC 11170 / ATH 1.1.1 / DSM 467 / LMG 4362 / NCIMB 8255 / S1) TaxID=269796 RepID=Q2RWZ2_RHORT|nr:hypothetical protein [Rhodospirillum rubrum]ABC21353.1 hypothetical protein Rru_A0549 [Rhodospirillum rubrum ATCC 11170]AEO47033.1 hypothetical protein F11_02815 [Rhodospirillum rubrum F11]MBK5952939.1 hypothetical protein [Rhodospirillum rubrum]QXG81033.1 hypothetical protein KUL73_02865 [Rhodospirillum rubrum]
MITALTSDNSLSFGSYEQIALDNMQSRAAQAIQKKQTALNETFQAKSNSIDKASDRLIKTSSGIKTAEIAVDNSRESLDTITEKLSAMRAALGELERSDYKSDYWRNQYDENLRSLNVAADLYSPAYNLVGKVRDRATWAPNEISYNSGIGSSQATLRGAYVGSDFRIEMADGTVWVPDLGSQSISEYTSYNTEKPSDSDATGRTTSLTTGITSVTDNGDGTMTFAMILDGGVSTNVTGKLVTGGLGVTGSWNHNSTGATPLSTAEDVAGALAELDKADAVLTGAKALMAGNANTVKGHEANLNQQMKDLTTQKKTAMQDNLTAQLKLQQEFANQVEVMQRNLESMSQQQQSYLTVFASTISGMDNNPLFVDQMA